MKEEISFGVWLRKQRRALDLTRQAFANQVGCAEVTLRRIEAGTLKPSKELVSILLEKLGIPQAEWPEWISFARGGSSFPEPSIPLSKKSITNLPVPITTFIGREKEQSDIFDLMANHRLVTLTGSGGVGKTRLAIKVVTNMLEQFPDGVWFLDLASLNDPELVPNTLAGLLGLGESGDSSFTTLLINSFSSRTVLIIFDNCEHLIEASARLVHSLLTSCQHLSILATSREALRVSGEIHYHVPSLDVPRPNSELTLDEISNMDSVKLFTERAATAFPGFVISPRNTLIVAEICQRLDGLPLAIELAAARADMLAVEQILKRLNDRFNLLTRGVRNALPRHQTLRATIEWSFDLLPEPERILFSRLPVFTGGFTLEAADVICSREGLKPNDMLDLLERLVEKSLLNVEQVITTGDTRYRLLETIREYLLVRLQESNEASMLREAHLKYFTRFVEKIRPKLLGHEQALWFARIEIEMDNLRMALDWSMDDISQDASGFLKDHANPLKVSQRIELCHGLGEVLNWQAKYTEAVDVYKLMLKSAEDLGDSAAQSRALYGIAYSLGEKGDNLTSLDYAVKAETLARRTDARIELAMSLWVQGIARYRLGEPHATLSLGEQALKIATELNNPTEIGRSLNLLGGAHYALAQYAQAESYWENALKIFQELGNRQQGMVLLNNLGAIADVVGDHNTAFQRYHSALEIAREIGNRDREILFLTNRGGTQVALGNYGAAEADLQQAIQLAGSTGSWCLPITLNDHAEALIGLERYAEALDSAEQALLLAEKDGAPEYMGMAWRTLGLACEKLGKPIRLDSLKDREPRKALEYDARACFSKSEAIFTEAEIEVEHARTLREWARYELRLGNKESGLRMWHEARKIFEELGARWEVERMATLL
jgi:Predicted ATPase